jgi:ABC-type multidrug transport system ATPase subunit
MHDHAEPPPPRESAPQLAIDAVGLAKSFGGRPALTGFDLVVPEGSVTALIGPNGSGKTTTIRILSTLLAPDAGRATVFGHDVVAEPEAVRAAIGVTGALVAEGTPSELKRRAPGGRIRLHFAGDDALAAAAVEFGGAERSDDDLSLELASDGSVAGIRHVLDRLERHGITVESLSAQPPDLDDVFFALTGGVPEPSRADSMEEGQ